MLYKGAVINENPVKSLNPGALKLRNTLISNGIVKNKITTEDILFSSPTAAAVFVLGYNISGPATWKTKDGQTLKEVEQSKTQ